MYIYTCNDFTGHYPVGTAAVIVATSEQEARNMLRNALIGRGLPDHPFTLVEIDAEQFGVFILRDGNY